VGKLIMQCIVKCVMLLKLRSLVCRHGPM